MQDRDATDLKDAISMMKALELLDLDYTITRTDKKVVPLIGNTFCEPRWKFSIATEEHKDDKQDGIKDVNPCAEVIINPCYELIIGRKYKHYKGQEYEVLGIAKNSETEEEMVIYKALYGNYQIWVRPLEMFSSKVLLDDGTKADRFQLIEENKEEEK